MIALPQNVVEILTVGRGNFVANETVIYWLLETWVMGQGLEERVRLWLDALGRFKLSFYIRFGDAVGAK